MNGRKYTYSIAALALAGMLGASPAVLAAEKTPPSAPSADSDAKTKALEERVRQLEKHIADLESQKRTAPAQPKNFGMQQGDFNRMFEEMRRQMLEMNGFFSDEAPPLPLAPMAPNSGTPRHGHRGALGIAIGDVNDELRSRYKSDVKEGAFVLNVMPNSPAEKAGIAVGDAVTGFDGQNIDHPKTLIDAVRNAAKGTHEITVSRHGEALKLKVELNGRDSAMQNPPLVPNGLDQKTHMEIKVSALQLSDELAKDLKLSDDQKKKMTDVLATHSKGLSDEFAKSFPGGRAGGAFGFTIDGNLTELANKHAESAAKDLATVLSPDQLKKWNEYRNSHVSISFSQSTQMGNAGTGDVFEEDDGSRVKF